MKKRTFTVSEKFPSVHMAYDGGPQGMPIPPLLQFYRLSKQQWLAPDLLDQLQLKMLSALLRNTYRNVRYYKTLFDSAGVKIDAIRAADDLMKVPITQRTVLQTLSVKDIVKTNVNLRRSKKILTAGSTGSPLMVYRTRREDNRYDVVWARAFTADGARLRDTYGDYHAYRSIRKRWFEHLGIWRRVMIPTLETNERKARIIERANPDVIRGDPFEVVTLARTVREKNIRGIKPRLVFTMGSRLDKQSRSFIEASLDTTVYDIYGSTELGCIAWECPMRSGYHINADTVIVEVIKEDGSRTSIGERGRLICTGLIAQTMPFIRYDTGDIGVRTEEACSCGRGLPLIRSIEGRADDFLVAANGELLPPSVIANRVKLTPGLVQFRIVQENLLQTKVELVLERRLLGQRQIVTRILNELMGPEVEIKVELVSSIPYDSSGKIRAIVSKVSQCS